MKAFVLWVIPVCLAAVFAEDPLTQETKHFEYDPHAALDIREVSFRKQGSVTIHDLTYTSPKGGRVPAYLVLPERTSQTKLAGIVWGHWMMPKSTSANRSEFLAEAIALTPAGAVSLLIDAPQVRPGFREDPDPLGPQGANVLAQQVIDLRRGLDLLASRGDLDPKRLAVVGHSFDSGAAAILDAVDKRPAAFVFMGGPQSIRDYALYANTPDIAAFRKSVPLAKIRAYLDKYAWADPATYQTRLGPAPALFQYATHDDFVPAADARRYFTASSGPKEEKVYNATHALNTEARRDRTAFLREHLRLETGTVVPVP